MALKGKDLWEIVIGEETRDEDDPEDVQRKFKKRENQLHCLVGGQWPNIRPDVEKRKRSLGKPDQTFRREITVEDNFLPPEVVRNETKNQGKHNHD